MLKCPLLITFEGIDGSGKSTQAQLLYLHFKHLSYKVELFREPGGTKLGDLIRSLLLNGKKSTLEYVDFGEMAEFLLFSAARAELVRQVIEPALKGDTLVLIDRFTDSSIAYQGYGRGMDINFITSVNQIVTNSLKPDLTILFDIPSKDALSRLNRDADRMEASGLPFLEKVREGYLEIARLEPMRFRIIDASLDIQTIHHKVIEAVKPLIESNKD